MRKINILLMVIVIISVNLPSKGMAVCRGSFINPISDICWQCMFPLSIGGVKLLQNEIKPDLDMGTESAICVCKNGTSFVLGLSVGFFEPARIIETVKDPYCFTILGTSMDNPEAGFLGGTHVERSTNQMDQESLFQQAHWYIFPVFALIDMFYDLPCLEEQSFDIAYLTEIDPLWNDDLLSFIINPEALLFGNPVAQLSCVADAISTNMGDPINSLFWCMGSWGSAYPLSGHMNTDNYVQGNAALAARMIYKLGREALLWDTGSDVCGAVMTPIWRKDHYRMHIMKPVRDGTCHPIGKSSLIWGSSKNPPFEAGGNASDNFAWMLFRKRTCCVGYSYP